MDDAVVTGTKPIIEALTGIRAFAAAWVVLQHFHVALLALLPTTQIVMPWLIAGSFGVEIFFVLSGFIISYNYAERFSHSWRGYRNYLVNRFARIYPVHLVTLIGVAGMVYLGNGARDYYTLSTLPANIFLLQGFGGRPWNGPSWSLSYEALAYIAFPAVAMLLIRLKRTWVVVGVLVPWVLAGTAVLCILYFETFVETENPVWVCLGRIAVEFLAGALIFRLWQLIDGRQSVVGDVLAVIGVVGTIVVIGLTEGNGRLFFASLPFLVLFVAGVAFANGPVARFLSLRVMQWGGRISYSLYMFHWLVMLPMYALSVHTLLADKGLGVRLVAVVVPLLVAVAGAHVLYRMVEEPARRGIRNVERSAVQRRLYRTV